MSHYHIIDCSRTNVTSSAYVEIIASVPFSTSAVQFVYFNPAGLASGLMLAKVAEGAERVEEDVFVCSQQNAFPISAYFNQGVRLSVKAIGPSMTSGYLILCLLP